MMHDHVKTKVVFTALRKCIIYIPSPFGEFEAIITFTFNIATFPFH